MTATGLLKRLPMAEKLSALRSKMKEFKLEAYIIPSEDAHQVLYLGYHLLG
jgi:hypothetical protein